MPLNNLFKKIEALELFDIEKETIDIINKNGYYISALLRLQLQQGKDSLGQDIKVFGRDYYSDRTVFDKTHGNYPALGKVTAYITLFKTGQFYMGLDTKASGRTFKTESDVSYFEEILAMVGENVMKLNKEHLEQFSQEILIPQLRARFKAMSG